MTNWRRQNQNARIFSSTLLGVPRFVRSRYDQNEDGQRRLLEQCRDVPVPGWLVKLRVRERMRGLILE